MMKWSEIVKEVVVHTSDSEELRVDGNDIKWPLAAQYPECHNLDLLEYLDVKDLTPLHIAFSFAKIENIGLTLLLEVIVR